MRAHNPTAKKPPKNGTALWDGAGEADGKQGDAGLLSTKVRFLEGGYC